MALSNAAGTDEAAAKGAAGAWPWLLVVAFTAAPLSLAFFAMEQADFLRGALSRGQIPGRDFINFWTGSRLLIESRVFEIYDQADYARALAETWGPGLAAHSLPYPPSIFPLIAWTGALPYGLALALWSVGGVLALFAAAWPYGRRPAVAAAIALSPAALICLDVGQNGLFTAALLVGGLRLVERRPWLGGALIGLVTFKPQLGLLIPIALLAAGRWRAIGGAAAAAVALAAAGTLMTGVEAWPLYLQGNLVFQREFLLGGSGAWRAMTPSPLAAALGGGLPKAAAYALQGMIALVCAAMVFLRFRRARLERRPIGGGDLLILAAAGFLAAPYSFNYDMASVALALVVAAGEQPELDSRPAWRLGLATLWTAPILMTLGAWAAAVAGAGWAPVGAVLMSAGLAFAWIGARGPAN